MFDCSSPISIVVNARRWEIFLEKIGLALMPTKKIIIWIYADDIMPIIKFVIDHYPDPV
jgi:hypothetical protein